MVPWAGGREQRLPGPRGDRRRTTPPAPVKEIAARDGRNDAPARLGERGRNAPSSQCLRRPGAGGVPRACAGGARRMLVVP